MSRSLQEFDNKQGFKTSQRFSEDEVIQPEVCVLDLPVYPILPQLENDIPVLCLPSTFLDTHPTKKGMPTVICPSSVKKVMAKHKNDNHDDIKHKKHVLHSYKVYAKEITALMDKGWSKKAATSILESYRDYGPEYEYIVSIFTSSGIKKALKKWQKLTEQFDIDLNNNSLFMWGKNTTFDRRADVYDGIASFENFQKIKFLIHNGVEVKLMDLWFSNSTLNVFVGLLTQACSNPLIFKQLHSVNTKCNSKYRVQKLKEEMSAYQDTVTPLKLGNSYGDTYDVNGEPPPLVGLSGEIIPADFFQHQSNN